MSATDPKAMFNELLAATRPERMEFKDAMSVLSSVLIARARDGGLELADLLNGVVHTWSRAKQNDKEAQRKEVLQ